MTIGSEKILSSEAMEKIVQSEESLTNTLRAMGAKNTDPPRPPAPYLKEIKSGIIHVWNVGMANRPDLVVCCDENGNEDPASWMGQRPVGMRADGTMPTLAEIPAEILQMKKKRAEMSLSQQPPSQIDFDRAVTEFGLPEVKTYTSDTASQPEIVLDKKEAPLSPAQPHIDFNRAVIEFGFSEVKTYSEPTEINSAMPFSGMNNFTMEEKIKEIQRITGLIGDE